MNTILGDYTSFLSHSLSKKMKVYEKRVQTMCNKCEMFKLDKRILKRAISSD